MTVHRSVVGVVGVVVLAACSSGEDPRSGESDAVGGDAGVGLVARSQSSGGGSLILDELTLPAGGGFVVVHADGGGAPGELLVSSEHLAGGPASDLTVGFDDRVPGGRVWVMVHSDGDADGEFDVSNDLPATVDGAVVVLPIEVELKEP